LKAIFDKMGKTDNVLKLADVKQGDKSAFDIILEDSELEPGEQEDATEFFQILNEALSCFKDTNLDELKVFQQDLVKCQGKEDPIKTSKDPQYVINLPISGTSISDCMKEFLKEETFAEGEGELEVCGVDGKKGMAEFKKITIEVPEEVENIIISLKRFEFISAEKTRKIQTSITPDTITIDGKIFQVKGCIKHNGKIPTKGHYVYYTFKDGKPDMIFDDSNFRKISSAEDDINTNGYLFLYEKVKGPKESTENTESTENKESKDSTESNKNKESKDSTENTESNKNKESKDSTESKESTEPGPLPNTVKLSNELRVRVPDDIKEEIQALKFTPSEEILFAEYLKFDHPFIREYLQGEGVKEKFYDFWKLYVSLDGTDKFNLMTYEEGRKIQSFMKDVLKAYKGYLMTAALPFLLGQGNPDDLKEYRHPPDNSFKLLETVLIPTIPTMTNISTIGILSSLSSLSSFSTISTIASLSSLSSLSSFSSISTIANLSSLSIISTIRRSPRTLKPVNYSTMNAEESNAEESTNEGTNEESNAEGSTNEGSNSQESASSNISQEALDLIYEIMEDEARSPQARIMDIVNSVPSPNLVLTGSSFPVGTKKISPEDFVSSSDTYEDLTAFIKALLKVDVSSFTQSNKDVFYTFFEELTAEGSRKKLRDFIMGPPPPPPRRPAKGGMILKRGISSRSRNQTLRKARSK